MLCGWVGMFECCVGGLGCLSVVWVGWDVVWVGWDV